MRFQVEEKDHNHNKDSTGPLLESDGEEGRLDV